jgi:hypothetical protein
MMFAANYWMHATMDDQILTALNTIGIKRRGVLNDAPMRMKLSDLAFFNISFSLAGEDIVLAKALQEKLRNREPGFYVDAGCFDPRLGSNSYLSTVTDGAASASTPIRGSRRTTGSSGLATSSSMAPWARRR